MDLVLERGDLLQLDPISNRGTLCLFGVGKKGRQKLVIGDDAGQVGCYEFTKGDVRKVFSVKPFEGPVASVALSSSSAVLKDEVVASYNQTIVRLTKKGVEKAPRLSTSRTEPINHLCSIYPKVWMGCECIFSLFDNNVESDLFYMARHQITCMVVDYITRSFDFDVALGCQDDCVRILQGAELVLEIPALAPVTTIAVSPCSEDYRGAKVASRLLYGTESGSLNLVSVLPTPPVSGRDAYVSHWSLPDAKRSAVTSLSLNDVTKDGTLYIIVGRDDGRIEVWNQDRLHSAGGGLELSTEKPTLRFTRDIGESIKTVDCGLLNSTQFKEVVLASFSGKVISFTSEPVRNRAPEDQYGRSVQALQDDKRISFLKSELTELRKTVQQLRAGGAPGASGGAPRKGILTSLTSGIRSSLAGAGGGGGGGAGGSDTSLSLPAPSAGASGDFLVSAKFALDPESSQYSLSLEVQAPLDMVVVRSPVVLDLTDGPAHAALSNASGAVISITPPSMLESLSLSTPDNPCRFLAAVRAATPQERRLALFLRPNEGESGDLILTVVTASNPKMAKMVKFPLRPLSLHVRVHIITDAEAKRPRHRVKFSGSVSLLMLHEWISVLFPDLPPNIDEAEATEELRFRNAYTSAITLATLRKGELEIESESASTIAIVRKTITDQANYRRVHVSETLRMAPEAIGSFLSLLRSRLEYQLSLSRKHELLDTLTDIAVGGGAGGGGGGGGGDGGDGGGGGGSSLGVDPRSVPVPPCFTPEYAAILRTGPSIRSDFHSRDKSLTYLFGVITDLYVDWFSSQGADRKAMIPDVMNAISCCHAESGGFEALVAMFSAGVDPARAARGAGYR